MTTVEEGFPGDPSQRENELLGNGASVVADSDVAVLFKSDGTKLLTNNQEKVNLHFLFIC